MKNLPFLKYLKYFKPRLITIYALKEFIPTLIIAFLFFFVIFFINHILLHIKPLLAKNIPGDLIAMIMVSAFPMIIVLSLPFTILLSTLMTMGRFSADNEIIAFRSLGFNMMQIFGPIFIVATIVSLFSFVVNDYFLPVAYKQQLITEQKILKIKPTLNFRSKTVKHYTNKTIFTDIVKNDMINGLIIIDKDSNNQKRIISASTAKITSPKNRKSVIELEMKNTMIQMENRDRPTEFNYGYSDMSKYFFVMMDFTNGNVSTPNFAQFLKDIYKNVVKFKKVAKKEIYNREKNIITNYEKIQSLKATHEQYLNSNISSDMYDTNLKNLDSTLKTLVEIKKNKYKHFGLNTNLIEMYKKFAFPLACIIFAIFAAPVGVYSKRARYAFGFIIGLMLSAFYWFFFMGFNILGNKMLIPPFIAMFTPNLFFLFIGLYFLLKKLKE